MEDKLYRKYRDRANAILETESKKREELEDRLNNTVHEKLMLFEEAETLEKKMEIEESLKIREQAKRKAETISMLKNIIDSGKDRELITREEYLEAAEKLMTHQIEINIKAKEKIKALIEDIRQIGTETQQTIDECNSLLKIYQQDLYKENVYLTKGVKDPAKVLVIKDLSVPHLANKVVAETVGFFGGTRIKKGKNWVK